MQFLTDSHALALVRAIHEKDGDTPRLVLADYLDDNGGEVEARFTAHLRAQCKMHEIWPTPVPPKELDEIPDPARRREYWLAETAAKGLVVGWRDWLGVGRRTREGSVAWRRGMPHYVGAVQAWVQQWRARPCWPWFVGLTLTGPGGYSTAKIAKPLADDLRAGVVIDLEFGDGFSAFQALDVLRVVYRYCEAASTLPILRRLTLSIHSLYTGSVDRLLENPFVRHVTGLIVTVRPIHTFEHRQVHRLQEALAGRVVVDTSACVGGTRQPRGW